MCETSSQCKVNRIGWRPAGETPTHMYSGPHNAQSGKRYGWCAQWEIFSESVPFLSPYNTAMTEIHKNVYMCLSSLSCPPKLSFSWSHLHLKATRKNMCLYSKWRLSMHCSNVFLILLSTYWSRKRSRDKNVEKGKKEGREWWKRKGKTSLMSPAKIFRLLPHDASPCPTHACTLTRWHMYTHR